MYYHVVTGTVSKLTGFNPVAYYFDTRNRLLTVLKYFYGLHLIRAVALNIMIMLAHLIKGPAIRRRITVYVITKIFTKYIKYIVKARKTYIKLLKRREILKRFIRSWPYAIITILEGTF
jgi:hypothetical protein